MGCIGPLSPLKSPLVLPENFSILSNMYRPRANIWPRAFGPHNARRLLSFYVIASVLTGFAVPDAFSAELSTQRPADLTKEAVEFFESRIRPVLIERCYECHSSKAKKVRGGLLLDSQQGVMEGGISGPVILPGDTENSPLIQAIRWTDSEFAMPPKASLTPQQVQNFEQWVKMGAPDPRIEAPPKEVNKAKTRDLAADRNWWAFRPAVEADRKKC